MTGNAFVSQPTKGDNPRYRNKSSNHQGAYWIGTYENYQGKPGQKPGGTQKDRPTGTLTSSTFLIPSGTLSFLIGGGSSFKTRVELLVVDPIEGPIKVEASSGKNNETMERIEWDLTRHTGKQGKIRIVDESSEGWGHINVDDFQFSGAKVLLNPNLKFHFHEFPKPKAVIDPSNLEVIQGEPAIFRSRSVYDPDGSIVEHWKGPDLAGRGPVFEINTNKLKPGRYQIVLDIADNHRQTDSVSAVLTVKPPKIAYRLSLKAEPDQMEEGQRTRLIAVIFPEAPEAEYRFDYGDGKKSGWSSSRMDYSYSSPGTYHAFVESRIGGKTIRSGKTAITVHKIEYSLQLNTDPSSTLPGERVMVTALLKPFTPEARYRFDFGDGTPHLESNRPKMTHGYSSPGTYYLSVMVTLGRNHSLSEGARITVQKPQAPIVHDPLPPPWVPPWELLALAGVALIILGGGVYLYRSKSGKFKIQKPTEVNVTLRTKEGPTNQEIDKASLQQDIEVRLRPAGDAGTQEMEQNNIVLGEEQKIKRGDHE